MIDVKELLLNLLPICKYNKYIGGLDANAKYKLYYLADK